MLINKTESIRQAQLLIDQGRVSAAISMYQKIVETDFSDLAAISVLSDLYVKAGRVPEAAEHFARIAEHYMRSGSAISAVYILNKILKLDPENARAQMNLGECYYQEGKAEQAHECFIEAGAAFWHKGNVAAAIKMNERALVCVPQSRQAKTALALLSQEIDQAKTPKRPKATTTELEPILISIPDEPGAPDAFQYSQAQAEPPPIVAEPVQMLPIYSREPLAQELEFGLDDDAIVEKITEAELLVAQGEADQAVALLRGALHHRPDHIQIREKLKDIYLRSGMIDRAAEECLNIAGIYAARGDSGRARDHIMRARQLRDPDDPIALLSVAQQRGGKEAGEIQEGDLEGHNGPGQQPTVM